MKSAVIFIIYQNQLFAEGLESILQKNHNVIKSSATDLKALTLIDPEKIELLIIESNWPLPRLENTIDEYLLFIGKSVKIILITNFINKIIFRYVYKGKIQGIVLKCSNVEELLFAINHVSEGKQYYSSLVANVFLKNNLEPQMLKVTKREKQILTLLSGMSSTSEIARKLSITKSTVKTHRRNLMKKLNAKNILSLLRLACRENLMGEENDFCGCCYKQFIGA